MNDVPLDLSLLWEQVDVLRALEKAPAQIILRNPGLEENIVTCDHVCGPTCVHLIANDSGSYTCTKSGMCFGRQLAIGCNDNGVAFLNTNVSPVLVRTPTSSNVGRPEMFSAACMLINKLVDAQERLAVNDTKAAKARKCAFRSAVADFRDVVARNGTVHWLSILNRSCAAFEMAGGGVRRRVFTQDRRTDVASLVADIYQVLIIPYCRVEKKKPTRDFYCMACLYLLAEGFGEASRVDKDILLATLPPEKLLKSMGICVSRVTAAKRYIKDALAYLNANSRKRKTRDESCSGDETYVIEA